MRCFRGFFVLALASSLGPLGGGDADRMDARALLAKAARAAAECGSARIRVEVELEFPSVAAPTVPGSIAVEVGPRLHRAQVSFARPFRIEAEGERARDSEPFSVAFDGRKLRHLRGAERMVLVERRSDWPKALESYRWLAPPGSIEPHLLVAAERDEVSLESGEAVGNTPCEVVCLRTSDESARASASSGPIVRELRLWLGREDHLAKRWRAETWKPSEEGRVLLSRVEGRVKARVELEVDPERFALPAPEGCVERNRGEMGPDRLEIGDPTPFWKLPDTRGRTRRSSELRGRVVLLDFWSTACTPCVANLDRLQSLHERFEKRGLTVVGIHAAEPGERDPVEFLNERSITYLNLLQGASLKSEYGVRGIPHLFLFAKDGTLAYQNRTNEKGLETTLVEQIEELLR